MGGAETRALAKARHTRLQGAGATACLRARPTASLRVIITEAFVGMGRWFMGMEEHVVVRCPCCDAVDIDTRHARICSEAGAQVNQHQPLVHATSRTLKRPGIRYQVESGEPFTGDRNLRMDIVGWRGGPRDAPNWKYRRSLSCWTSSVLTLKRRCTCEEAVLMTMDQQAPILRSSGTCVF